MAPKALKRDAADRPERSFQLTHALHAMHLHSATAVNISAAWPKHQA